MSDIDAAALSYFDEQPRMAILLDVEGRVMRVSARLRAAMGLSEGDALGFTLEERVEAGSREALRGALQACREPGSGVTVSFAIPRADLAPLELRWQLSRSRDGKVIFAAVVEDTQSSRPSGRVRDAELAWRRDLLQYVVDHMPVVVWALDERGHFTLSDGRALAMLGLETGQVVGKDAFELYADDPQVIDRMHRALQGHATVDVTYVGGRSWENRFIPIERDDGSIEGMFGFSLDITERIERERELHQKLALIEEQESAIRSLSTPIVRVWTGVLALPLVGVLDESRIERILSALLEAVVSDQAEYVILDMTGIETVDDTTADHVFKVLRALALLGAQAIVTGVRPGVARALVEIGVDLVNVMTLGNLEEAIRFIMKRRSKAAVKAGSSSPSALR